MYEQSHRDTRSAIRIIVRPSWVINHYRDNAITYSLARQNTENWKLANAAITDMVMRVSVMLLALDAKYTKELADAKAEMMLCVMMLPLVVVGCTSAVRQSVREATTRFPAG